MAALVLVAVMAALSFGGLVLANLGDAPPAVSLQVALPSTRRAATTAVQAPAPPLPWASSGGSAVAVPSVGFAARPAGPEHSAPVASLTKIMTAYVVLHDHPLRLGQAGPTVLVTTADAQQFGTDTVTDQSTVALQAGEHLSEQQMLQGLLVHSANDLAYSLANWDAGSVPAFVAKMNATAAQMGMSHTHFADASGFDPASASTAADLLRVAAACMEDPVFRSIVRQPSVTLPISGTLPTYTPLLGTPGVVGVKSGFTTQAGGGDVLAYRATVDGRPVTALAAVTNQEGPQVLAHAGQEALALAKAALQRVGPERVAARGARVGTATENGHPVALVLARSATLDVVPGAVVRQSVRWSHHPRGGVPAGTPVGWATFAVGTQRARVRVITAGRLSEPSWFQRLW